MKQQVFYIHGGESFDTHEDYMTFLKSYVVDLGRIEAKRWKDSLAEDLGLDFQVIAPQMPNKLNAKYAEWKIWFEKFIPFIQDGVILIGHSLGGIFFAKYLSENIFPKKIKATFLLAAPFDDENAEYSLADFRLGKDLSLLLKQGGEVCFYQSKDDPVVTFDHFEKYQKALPGVKTVVFEDKQHFNQSEFVEAIKKLA